MKHLKIVALILFCTIGFSSLALTTPPTAMVNSTNAGPGSECSLSQASDKAGFITLTEVVDDPTYPQSGDMCTVTFNTAYAGPAICTITQQGPLADPYVNNGAYVTSTATTMTLYFQGTDFSNGSYAHVYSYHCLQTPN